MRITCPPEPEALSGSGKVARVSASEASLTDVKFERCELRAATFSAARIERVELSACDLAGASAVEALRGARMSWDDVLANAPVFASAIGIEIVD